MKDSLARHWSRESIIYHIYPKSFKDTNGDGVGDLKGIIEKLDYLNDGTDSSLGVNAIWLSPVYRSPMADHGYDISDHKDIDPIFGDMATFDLLIKEAHARGIKVLMDFVPNHTSSEHPWFEASRSSRHDPKRDWYIWRDPQPNGDPPNNWLSVFGGSAWRYDGRTKQYYLHTFLSEQPDLNWRNEAVRHEMIDTLGFWLHRGVDGFRTDAIYHLLKDDAFRDDPLNPQYDPRTDDDHHRLTHTHSAGNAALWEAVDSLCEALGKKNDPFMVSEAYVSIPEMERLYRACNNHRHAPFNFRLMSLPWDATRYRTYIDTFESALEHDDWPAYVLGNHDRPRIATRLGKERSRLAAMLLLTLRGMPVIYYGDEIGMENVAVPHDDLQDPVGKAQLPNLPGRDPERTPMQWSDSPYAEFSASKPWLPIASNFHICNVRKESSDPHSLLSLYRQLIHIRRNSKALMHGTYHSLPLKNEAIFAFVREYKNEKILVALNFSATTQLVSFNHATGSCLVSTHLSVPPHSSMNTKALSLRPFEGYVIKLR